MHVLSSKMYGNIYVLICQNKNDNYSYSWGTRLPSDQSTRSEERDLCTSVRCSRHSVDPGVVWVWSKQWMALSTTLIKKLAPKKVWSPTPHSPRTENLEDYLFLFLLETNILQYKFRCMFALLSNSASRELHKRYLKKKKMLQTNDF